ncbi:MAG: PKD domain-containing protein [Bacteroidota bacterium]
MRYSYNKTRLNLILRIVIVMCIYMGLTIKNSIAQNTFPCDGKIYFFGDRGANDPYLSYFDGYLPGGTPKITNMCVLTGVNNGNAVNALGANPIDGYLYFLERSPSGTVRLKRIRSNCNVQNVCTGLIPWSIQACFDHQGIYWILDDTGSPYKLRGYDITNCTQVRVINLNGVTSSDVVNDITYDNRDCHFYIGAYKIDYATGNKTAINKFGGAGLGTGADGHLYSIGGSDVEQYDIITQNKTTVLNQGSGGPSDAASFPCANVSPAFSFSIAAGCTLPRSVSFTDNSSGLVTTWFWEFGDGNTSTLQNPTHIYSTAGPFTVKLTASSTTTCLTTATGVTTVVFSIPSNPSLNNSNKTDVSCNGGNNGSATISVSGGTSPYTYTWSPSAGTGPTISNLTAGTYSLTVTDNAGCSATTTTTILQPTALSLNSLGSTLNCVGGTDGSVAVTASGGTAPYTYLWTSGSTDASVLNLSAGTYTLTVTDNNGCTKNATATVASPAPIVLTPSSTDATCGGSNGSASVSVSGGSSPYAYSWSPGGETTATISAISGGSYTVSITDNKSCTQTTTVVVNNSGAATLTVDSTAVTCNGGTNGTATVSVSGGTSPYTYSWNSNPAQTTTTATVLPAGVYTVVVRDNVGCISSIPVTIIEPTAVALTISNTNVSCLGGNNGTATTTATGGSGIYTYAWSSGDSGTSASNLSAGTYTVTATDNAGCTGLTTVVISQPSAIILTPLTTSASCFGGNNGTATVSVSGGTTPYTYSWSPETSTLSSISNLTAGNYVVVVSDSNSCTNSATIVVTEPTVIGLTTSKTDLACFGDNIGTASVIASGGTAPYTYAWSPTGGTTSNISNLAPNTYTITVTDNNTCTQTAVITITEPPVITLATPLTTANVSCFGGNNGSASVSVSGGTGPYTYAWSPSGGSNLLASNLSAGTYTVVITDDNGCIDIATATVNQPVDISVIPSGSDVTCTGGNDGTATVSTSGGTGTYTYLWSPSGETGSNISNLTAGTYTVTVTDNNGCTKSNSITITESGLVSANFTPDPVSGTAPLNVNFTNNSTGGTQYQWDFGDGTIDSVYNPTHVYNKPGTYTVTLVVININGCSEAHTSIIKVVEKSELCVPNVFTPNGDGNNDVFDLCGKGMTIIKGTIYNRWGMLLFQWDQPKGTWDGRTSAGQEVPDGTYYYIIYVQSDDDVEYPEQKGFIQLLRSH